jgi:hypothetical protein
MSAEVSSIFIKLPEDMKYLIYKFALITQSSIALKTYLGWYNNFLKWNVEKISFKQYFFTKLKRLDKDLLIRIINYKLIKTK